MYNFTRAKDGSERVSTVLKKLVDVTSNFVTEVEFVARGIIVDVLDRIRRDTMRLADEDELKQAFKRARWSPAQERRGQESGMPAS